MAYAPTRYPCHPIRHAMGIPPSHGMEHKGDTSKVAVPMAESPPNQVPPRSAVGSPAAPGGCKPRRHHSRGHSRGRALPARRPTEGTSPRKGDRARYAAAILMGIAPPVRADALPVWRCWSVPARRRGTRHCVDPSLATQLCPRAWLNPTPCMRCTLAAPPLSCHEALVPCRCAQFRQTPQWQR